MKNVEVMYNHIMRFLQTNSTSSRPQLDGRWLQFFPENQKKCKKTTVFVEREFEAGWLQKHALLLDDISIFSCNTR